MNTLIVKLGATGDVVRTSALLHKLEGEITWLTEAKNLSLIKGVAENLRSLTWDEKEQALDRSYDLVINLEDEDETAAFLKKVTFEQLYGAYLSKDNSLQYTQDSRPWFDLSLISRFGRERADELKCQNRRSYQDLLFSGFGWKFSGEKYSLPKATDTGLRGDVAISPVAGAVWPMKSWAYYGELQSELESRGYVVNVLQTRPTLLEHLGDVQGHRCLVSGDSLPMHLALGSNISCVSIFNCTSPWEIHEYGLLTKMISPLLEQYFYKRDFDKKATTAVPLEEALNAVVEKLS